MDVGWTKNKILIGSLSSMTYMLSQWISILFWMDGWLDKKTFLIESLSSMTHMPSSQRISALPEQLQHKLYDL
jgi:hypothetical protein